MDGLKEVGYVEKDNIENIRRTEIEKKLKHLGKIRMVPGLILWQVNYVTGEITKAETEKVSRAFVIGAKEQVSARKLVAKEDCIYIQALNLKNAIKKSNKWLNSINNK